MPTSSRRSWAAPHALSPTPRSESEPCSPRPYRDERLPPVLLFQGAQLCRSQQGQSQLQHHRGRHLGHRPLQHRLPTPALSPGRRGHLPSRPLAGFLRPEPPSAPPPRAPLSSRSPRPRAPSSGLPGPARPRRRRACRCAAGAATRVPTAPGNHGSGGSPVGPRLGQGGAG